jgi:hypothetical protein
MNQGEMRQGSLKLEVSPPRRIWHFVIATQSSSIASDFWHHSVAPP